jgi:hypothetical protein
MTSIHEFVLQFCSPEWGHIVSQLNDISFSTTGDAGTTFDYLSLQQHHQCLEQQQFIPVSFKTTSATSHVRIEQQLYDQLPPHRLILSPQCTKVLRLVQQMMYQGNMNLCSLQRVDPTHPFGLQDLSELFMFCQQIGLLTWLTEFVPFLNATICYYALGAPAMKETAPVYNEFIHWLAIVQKAGFLNSVCYACVVYSQHRWGWQDVQSQGPNEQLHWLAAMMRKITSIPAHIIDPQYKHRSTTSSVNTKMQVTTFPQSVSCRIATESSNEIPTTRHTVIIAMDTSDSDDGNNGDEQIERVLSSYKKTFKSLETMETICNSINQPEVDDVVQNLTARFAAAVGSPSSSSSSDDVAPVRKKRCRAVPIAPTKDISISQSSSINTAAQWTGSMRNSERGPYHDERCPPPPSKQARLANLHNGCTHCTLFRQQFRRSFFQNNEHYVCCNPQQSICNICISCDSIL